MTQLIDPLRYSLGGHLRRLGTGAPVPAAVIASTSTPVPGGKGNFDFMTFPQISGEAAAFGGAGKDQPANIYLNVAGTLRLFLAVGAGIPSTGGTFTGFGLPTVAQQAVAFVGSGSRDSLGVYVKSGEILKRIADSTMAVPGGTGNFSAFGQPGFDTRGTIAFVAQDGAGAYGVYSSSFPAAPAPAVVANSSTPIPGGGGTFNYFDGAMATEGGGITFFASRTGSPPAGVGIYTVKGSGIFTIANTSTSVPGAGGTFSAFAAPAASADRVVFHAQGSAGSDGIYQRAGQGSLQVVADLGTPVPGGHGTFQTFFLNSPSASGDDVAFLAGYENSKFGIFARVSGRLVRVVTSDDTIGGSGIINLGITVNQLAGGGLAFYAVTGHGIFGNYAIPVG
ncbi:MAG TPA: hypothetical protein VKY89_07845 [Thermoanaerobaculia bacterium]|jgi:hypothetical protein|nr:hypothetical protein [Thermoanaerobaculia bacterium]